MCPSKSQRSFKRPQKRDTYTADCLLGRQCPRSHPLSYSSWPQRSQPRPRPTPCGNRSRSCGLAARAKLTDADPPHWWCHKNRDWFTTWLVVDQLIPEQKDCLLSRLVTTFDPSDGSYHNAKGVEIDVVDFGAWMASPSSTLPFTKARPSTLSPDRVPREGARLQARGRSARRSLRLAHGSDHHTAPTVLRPSAGARRAHVEEQRRRQGPPDRALARRADDPHVPQHAFPSR